MAMIEAENLRTIEQTIHEEFVIEKILNKREQDGKIEYFVKVNKEFIIAILKIAHLAEHTPKLLRLLLIND